MKSILVDALIAASGSVAASILIKVTLTTAIALIAVQLARRSRAAMRHVMLASAFVILLALPIAAVVVPAIQIAIPAASTPAMSSILPGSVDGAPFEEVLERGVSYAAPANQSMPSVATLVAVAWAVGVVVFILPVIVGFCQVRSIRRSAISWRKGTDAFGGRAEVLVHEFTMSPMTSGFFRAAIVLPTDAFSWSDEDLQRAIVHEMEHVRRFDWATQCAARILCALYWFHPLVWIAREQFALEAERACDDAVLASAEPTAYANQLVSLAQRLSAAANSNVLGMANRRDLAARVSAVLEDGRPRGRASRSLVVINIAVCLLLLGTVSRLQLVGEGGQVAVAFEAATVKPSQPTGAPRHIGGCRGNDTIAGNGFRANIPLGRCVFQIARMSEILSDIYNVPRSRISGVPDWDLRSFFDVEAKAEDPNTTQAQLTQMLERLLVERFHLAMHHTTVEGPIFAIRVGKNGHKLKLSKDDSGSMTIQNGSLVFKGYSMANLTDFLNNMTSIERPVQDMTQLDGRFDFTVIVLETKQPESSDELKGAMSRSDSIVSDIQEQLGLRFDSEKGAVHSIVIDHAEKPSGQQ